MFVYPPPRPPMTSEGGSTNPLAAAHTPGGREVSLRHVPLLPGRAHDRHNHPESDEILYILAGEGDQMVDDGEPQRVRPGDTVFIPKGAFHSTINTGYEPMVILAIYAPAGAEDVLKTLPDYAEVPAGEAPALLRG